MTAPPAIPLTKGDWKSSAVVSDEAAACGERAGPATREPAMHRRRRRIERVWRRSLRPSGGQPQPPRPRRARARRADERSDRPRSGRAACARTVTTKHQATTLAPTATNNVERRNASAVTNTSVEDHVAPPRDASCGGESGGREERRQRLSQHRQRPPHDRRRERHHPGGPPASLPSEQPASEDPGAQHRPGSGEDVHDLHGQRRCCR